MANMSTRAAAVIVTALRKKNGQTRDQLEAELDAKGLPVWYLPRGVRKVRDAYGSNFLICDPGTYVYTLDPDLAEGINYTQNRARDSLTRAEHIRQGLDWLAATYGNRGAVRRARRYAASLVAELEELVEVTAS